MRLAIQITIIYLMFYVFSRKCEDVKSAAEFLDYDDGKKEGSIRAKTSTVEYLVSTDLVNWYQALINCKSIGMDLASLQTVEDQERLEKYLGNSKYNKGYWLGATNLGNGQYYWVPKGEPVVYTKWIPNQPDDAKLPENDYKGENCIQWGIYNSTPFPTGWNDLFCGYKLPYICQKVKPLQNQHQ